MLTKEERRDVEVELEIALAEIQAVLADIEANDPEAADQIRAAQPT